jgi:heptosyltransferase-2
VPRKGHAALWYAQGLPEVEPRPLGPTPEESSALLRLALPDGAVVLHPGSGSPGKNWPPEAFAALARALLPGREVIVVEGPADREAAAPALSVPGTRAVRGFPLRLLGALLGRSRLVVGNDSGVTHLAAAFGARVLALFGPTDPAVWAPTGDLVRVLRAPGGDLSALGTGEVLGAAARLLG